MLYEAKVRPIMRDMFGSKDLHLEWQKYKTPYILPTVADILTECIEC